MCDGSETAKLLHSANIGDSQALGNLLIRKKNQLTRIVRLRMDARLNGRVDAEDVVQEAFIEATSRFPEYARDNTMPFFLWLRFLTLQKLSQFHRRHLGAKGRAVSREVALYAGPTPQASSALLAAQLIGKLTTPSQAAVRAETKLRLEEALNSMATLDREILALRHFEQLTNAESAKILGITESAASNRYVRAVHRLRGLIERP